MATLLNPRIERYAEELRPQVLNTWEQSVRATHDFLKEDDFNSIKEIVWTIDFKQLDVFCLLDEKDRLAGFVGIANGKIEMLFINPSFFGQGCGTRLMEFVLREYGVASVDVNEQNTRAVEFYKKFGFKTYERTDKDDQGKDYPLLRMKLAR